jgi:outer membrane receptor protein involved in Fe transport
VAGFYNRYEHLQSLVQSPATPLDDAQSTLLVPFVYQNQLAGKTGGIETAAKWTPARSWRLQLSHTWFKGTMSYYDAATIGFASEDSLHTPRNTVDARLGWDMTRRWSLDTAVYHVSRLSNPDVPGYVRVDARVTCKLLESAEFSAGGENLLAPRHTEFVPNDYTGYSRIRRSANVKLVWRF